MHIIIVGCGRVGAQLAQLLSSEGHNIVIIDKKAEAFKRLGSNFNGISIAGVGFDPEILKRAGIEHADAFAAVTSGDNSNIMASQIAKKIYNVKRVITRIYDPLRADIYKKFGLNTISTTTIVAQIFRSALLKESSKLEYSIGLDAGFIEYKAREEEAA
ncbi:potassium transporter TrkA [candidate division WOR-1 bacterium RIFCSPLOWO2_02_FULL_46_20]|uniref:Potassium transporter TrkA n=2 Tax=Saganbacteria TaxID=1703751 RepID=A0A1F4RAI4_UNCSA|nr:MAG: potassium transporter TrkA [candidate division WOR-1 bacterium RIFCSPHIGHO2_02_FULL_45_12]OGC04533.1 MAG: potassium transporter TrkA [candidate division WOR-1 bacterium RIFCSPLOWO2_02_FULL_46_20]OGC09323.1 MAG: potassium transporter TrkA [candidate division WOR-1 bacterium RIFCSPLOWO2_12_FULL_45_9]